MKLQHSLYIIILSAAGILSSCSDKFFDTAPAGELTGDETFTSTANIDALINGNLRSSTSQDNPGYGAIMLTQEVMGEDAIARDGVYGFRDSYPFRDPSDNTTRRALFFWSFQYKVIDNCNNIIANVEQASGPDADKRYLKGQALALRAFVYLNLVRQYQFTYAKDKTAKAIPIYTEPTSPATQPKPRATVEEVYAQVISDLSAAETLLVGFKRLVKNRPDLNVVKGIFARTYLTTEQWDLAATKASEARAGYAIMEAGQYSQGFNDVSNVEWIWGHPQRADQTLAGASFFAYIDVTPATGYRSIMPDPNFRKLFADQDVRKNLFELVTAPADPMYRWYKYKKFVDKADRSGNIVLMRSSEMALIQAESKARLGDLPAAISALNDLRIKRNLAALIVGSYTQADLIEEILLERRRELWGEGFRLPDILRLQRTIVRTETTETFKSGTADVVIKGHYIRQFPNNSAFVPNSPYYLFSIPINEINTNPSL
jgi:hypothetical protein